MNIKTIKSFANRDVISHKWQNGSVLVIAGSKEFPGAAIMASSAAMHSGVDIVTLYAPEKVAWAMNAYLPDVITIKARGEYLTLRHAKSILNLAKKFDVVLMGNGMTEKSHSLMHCLVHKLRKPLVLDAEALRCLRLEEIHNAILTPHISELNSLLKNSGIKQITSPSSKSLKALQKYLGTNVLLVKGYADYVVSSSSIAKNTMHNSGMTKAGTGDVLAGLCAAFYAQTKDTFKSAEAAAYINGRIGNLLFRKKHGYTYLASEMAAEIIKMRKTVLPNPKKIFK